MNANQTVKNHAGTKAERVQCEKESVSIRIPVAGLDAARNRDTGHVNAPRDASKPAYREVHSSAGVWQGGGVAHSAGWRCRPCYRVAGQHPLFQTVEFRIFCGLGR